MKKQPTSHYYTFEFSESLRRVFSLIMTHPLKVEEVFLEGLSGLSLLALVDYIRVFFVATALVVFTAVSLPVSETHPAEVLQEKQHTFMRSACVFAQ